MTWLVWYLGLGAAFTVVRFVIAIAGSQYARSRGVSVATDFDTSDASLPRVVVAIMIELATWPFVALYIALKLCIAVSSLASALWTARKLRIAQEAGE